MKAYKVLVLTDHSGHSKENSLYPVLNQMIQHDRTAYIDVASRGVERNNPFFAKNEFEKVYVSSIFKGFDYSHANYKFWNKHKKVKTLDYDLVLLRLSRPISDDFLTGLSSYFLEKIVINNPLGILQSSNKSFLLNFQDLCPPIKLCHSAEEVLTFSKKFDVVLKPLKEYGGKGILKITADKLNDGIRDWDTQIYLKGIESTLTAEGYLAMKFLKNVDQGDKRILVVDGQILAASVRLPKKDTWLCNVAQGGTSVFAEITPREREIIQKLNPRLNKEGILMYGVDTLVDDNGLRTLSEVNTLSIGGYPQAEKQTGKPIIKITINKIFEYADARL